MKKWSTKAIVLSILAAVCFFCMPMGASAKEYAAIQKGIYAGDLSLAGLTVEEAAQLIEDYVASLETVEINLLAADGNTVVVTAGDLGISWANREILDDAIRIGSQGNVVQRYKVLKNLENENKVYPLELEFNIMAIDAILQEQCSIYDREAIDYTLSYENGNFSVNEGQIGYLLDIEHSIDIIYDYLTKEWNHEACSIELNIEVFEPRGSVEELMQVKDVLGSYTTSFTDVRTNRGANVINGCRLMNGITLYPGDEISALECMEPFTERNGYYAASSYLNGRVVDSLGGGICQVTTTLYNAVLLAELEITERYNHSMIVTYVDPAADAAVASNTKDFKFVNNSDYPIYIEGYTTPNALITFNIYGVETRDPGHKVEYVSEILETLPPVGDSLVADPSRPLGVYDVEGAHIGYKARLWKIVTENGKEVSREVVNNSSYKTVPRSAVIGVATDDPNVYNEIMAAIGTGSLDHVRNVIALLTTPQPAQ